MTADANATNMMLRNDTILGVCEALGEDFGINPTWLRVAFCLPVFWSPMLVIGAYMALGLVVAGTRYAFPNRTISVHANRAQLAPAESTATVVEERELIAA